MRLLTAGAELDLQPRLSEDVRATVVRVAREEFADDAPYLRAFVIKHAGYSIGTLLDAARRTFRAVLDWTDTLISRYTDVIDAAGARNHGGRIYFVRFDDTSPNGHVPNTNLADRRVVGFVVDRSVERIDGARLGRPGPRLPIVIVTGYFPPGPPLRPDGLAWDPAPREYVRARGEVASTEEEIASPQASGRTVQLRGFSLPHFVVAAVERLTAIVLGARSDGRPGFEFAAAVAEESLAVQHFILDTPMETQMEQERAITIEEIKGWAQHARNRESFIRLIKEYCEANNVLFSQIMPHELEGVAVLFDEKDGKFSIDIDRDRTRDFRTFREYFKKVVDAVNTRLREMGTSVTEAQGQLGDLRKRNGELLLSHVSHQIDGLRRELNIPTAARTEDRIPAETWFEKHVARVPELLTSAADPESAWKQFRDSIVEDYRIIEGALATKPAPRIADDRIPQNAPRPASATAPAANDARADLSVLSLT